MSEKISPQNVAEAAEEYSCLFGANKNLYRTIPSLIDGCKPGKRRLFWSWYEFEKKPKNIDSDTLKRLKFIKVSTLSANGMIYHPHGDAANQEIIGREGQYWNNNVMCIVPQGSYGSIRGDVVASGRYIEAKMSKYMIDCFFSDFDNYCVPMRPSYNGLSYEPEYLPAKYPHILFNPQLSGIGYGLASNIPPFNVAEVLKATIKLIKDKDSKILLIPDSPTGADIIDEGEFKNINKTGVGKFTLRATYEIDYQKNKIRFTSLPLQSSSKSVILKIIELQKKNEFTDIIEIHDNTKNGEVDLILFLKPNANPDKILKKLFKKGTNLKMTYPVGIQVIDDFKNYGYGVKDLLLEWIEYRRDSVRSMFNYSLQKLEEKKHMNEVLIKVFNKNNAEETLHICKTSKGRKETVERLVKKHNITSLQAETIADMQLYKFNKDSYQKFCEERENLKKEIKRVTNILENDEEIDNFIISQLEEGIKRYGRPRKSKVIREKDENDFISDTNHLIGITKSGYIKKITDDNTKIGVVGKNNEALTVVPANNKEDILVIDSQGYITKIAVSEIPDMKYEDSGVDIRRYFKTYGDIVSVLKMPPEKILDNKNVCMILVTKFGISKRVLLSDFKKLESNTLSIKLNTNDEVVSVLFTFDNSVKDIVIYTNLGNGIRLPISDIKLSTKLAKGIKQINLKENEFVVDSSKIDNSKKYLFYITSSGRCKITEMKYFPQMNRKDDSINLIKLEGNETLVGLSSVNKSDAVVAYRKNNEPVQIELSELPISTRISKGEKYVKTPKGDFVVGYKVFTN